MSLSDLEGALKAVGRPGLTPIPLPVAHLTAWRWLMDILAAGELRPRNCKYLSRDLLYFSYGGVFFRTDKLQTQQATELPVAFVFGPEVADFASDFFPFDSGAMKSGRFGPTWTSELDSFVDRFSVSPINIIDPAPAMVDAIYRTNCQYLAGDVDAACSNHPDPMPLLGSFLQADLSALGIDHRQRSIEQLVEVPITLSKHLLWIGFPRIQDDVVLERVYHWTRPRLPKWWSYPYHTNFNPVELAAKLELKAHEDVVEAYVSFEPSPRSGISSTLTRR